MPIVVPCPGCPSKLSAPDSAAGKQIRCPKCKAVASVPALIEAEEVQVVEAKVTAPAPKPKAEATVACCIICNTMIAVTGRAKAVRCPKCGFANPAGGAAADEDDEPPRRRSRRDDEDDEDDEDDRPRRKKARSRYADDGEYDHDRPRKKKRKSAGGGGGLVVVLAVLGGLALLGGLGYGAYALFGKGGSFAKKAPPPGWKEYSYPQSGFKAYFPSEPAVFGADVQAAGPPQVIHGVEVPQIESMYSYTTARMFDQTERATVSVSVMRFRSALSRANRDPMGVARDGFGRRTPTGEVKKVRWLGGDAAEAPLGGTLVRVVYTDRAVITVEITGPNGQRAAPDVEQAFFDNFELTK